MRRQPSQRVFSNDVVLRQDGECIVEKSQCGNMRGGQRTVIQDDAVVASPDLRIAHDRRQMLPNDVLKAGNER